jgi:hypothetical protein
MEVRFDIRNDAKMIPSVLRCFPNVETLHIKVKKPLILILAFIMYQHHNSSCSQYLADELHLHCLGPIFSLEKRINPLASSTSNSGTSLVVP